jgi:hypothetical protein
MRDYCVWAENTMSGVIGCEGTWAVSPKIKWLITNKTTPKLIYG